MPSLSRRIIAATVAFAVAVQPVAADTGYYFRNSTSAPLTNLAPGATENTSPPVKGNGDLMVFAPANARARPGVGFALAATAKGAAGAVTWQSTGGALPPGIGVNASTGYLSGVPTATGDFTGIVLSGTDSTGKQGSTQPITVSVVSRPTVTMPATVSVQSGQPLKVAPTYTNALGSQAWSLSAPLPVGLTLDSRTGTISGTSYQPGTLLGLVLTVTDADGASGSSQPFSLTVSSSLAMTGVDGGYAARVGKAFLGIRPFVGGAQNPLSWSVGSGTLPSGISLDPSTGAVSGTPVAAGLSGGLTLLATDKVSGAAIASRTFSINVGNVPAVSLANAAYAARIGTSLTVTPSASGLAGKGKWFVDGGSLPSGLGLDPDTGVISGASGTPMLASGLKLRVLDLYDGTQASSPTFAINILPQLGIAPFADVVGEAGQALSAPAPAAVGLVGKPTWSLIGSLPSGLAMNSSTGLIGGTPETFTPTPVNLQYELSDPWDNSQATGQPFTLSAIEKGRFAVAGIASTYSALSGKPFALTPTVLGAQGAVAWQTSKLPTWASFNPATGAITGTPSLPTSDDGIVLTATDAARQTDSSQPFSISAVASLAVSYSPGAIAQGQAYTLSPVVTNANGTVAFQLSGALPSGLAFDPATGVISGVTYGSGTFPLKVKATDASSTATSEQFSLALPTPTWSASVPAAPTGRPYEPFSVAATARGFTGNVAWTVASGNLPDWASFSTASGSVTGTPSETGFFGPITLQASDTFGHVTQTNPFNITITSATTAVTASAADAAATVNTPFSMSPTVTGTQGATTWSLVLGALPEWAALDPASGAITGLPDSPGKSSGIVLQVTDSKGGKAQTRAFAITTSISSIKVGAVPATLPATVGTSFTAAPPTVSGSTGALSWSVSSGALPSWARLNPDGSVSGTPEGAPSVGTTGGIVLQVTDGSGASQVTNAFAIQVSRAALAVTSPGDVSTHPGTAVASQAPVVKNALGTVTWSVSAAASADPSSGAPAASLPAGMSLDASTGRISGTPTAPSSGSFVLTARDSFDGATASSPAFAVSVLTSPVIGVQNYVGSINSPTSFRPTVVNAIGATTWSLAAGTLPAGMTLDRATGIISGTMTSLGTTGGIRLAVTDSLNASGTSDAFSIQAVNGIVFGFVPLPEGVYPTPQRVTVALSTATPALTNAVGSVTYSVVSGTIPPGMTFNASTGIATGTPTQAFTTSLVLSVTDANGTTATSPPQAIKIGPAPAVSVASVTARVGTQVYDVPSIANATADKNGFINVVVQGGLPAWAGINSDPKRGLDYAINGKPTAVASFPNLVMKVTDGEGAVGASQPFSITVTPGLSVSNVAPNYKGRAGYDLSPAVQPVLGNLVGTASWTSKNLPAGLSLDAATGVVSGKPTGPFQGTVTLTAVDSSDGATLDVPVLLVIYPPVTVANATGLTTHIGIDAATPAPTFNGLRGTAMSWSLGSGSLPSWATLDPATGIITARSPAQPSATGLSLTATDNLDHATGTSGQFSLTVLPPLAVTNVPTSYSAQVAIPFNSAPPSAENVNGTVRWSLAPDSAALPAWASVDPATGVIFGKPDAVGSFPNLKLQVADANSSAVSVPFTLSVISLVTVSLSSSSGTGLLRVGDNYTLTPSPSGLQGTPTWSLAIASGAMPAGLTQDPTSGAISGKVTAPGDVQFTIGVLDNANQSTASSTTVTLSAKPALTLSSIPNYTVHDYVPFETAAPTPGGVVGTVSYSLDPAVPAGMNPFNAGNGTMNGVASSALPATSYTVTATDSWDQRTAFSAFTIQINDPVAWSSQPADVVAAVGATVDAGGTLANGIGAVTYVLNQGGSPAPGALSACTGLGFDATTGRLKGTPSAACAVSGLSITATDSTTTAGNTATSSTFGVRVDSAYAFSAQPSSFTARRTATTTTVASLSGTPTGNVTWSLVDANGSAVSPPSWLTLTGCTSSGCTVSASPGSTVTLGAYPASGGYYLKVVDAFGTAKVSNGFNVTVGAPPVTASYATTAYNATVGTAYTVPAPAVTGSTSYSYALQTVSGTAPANASVSTAGVVTYTADAASAGTWVFNLKVTSVQDPSNSGNTQNVTVQVGAITTSQNPTTWSMVAGSAISFTNATNMTSPTWSLTGSPPAWLKIDATGKVSGNAAQIANATLYNFNVVATSGSATASKAFALTITLPTVTSSAWSTTKIRSGQSATAAVSTNLGGVASWSFPGNVNDQTVAGFGGASGTLTVTGVNTGTTLLSRTYTATATSGNIPSSGGTATAFGNVSSGTALTIAPVLAMSGIPSSVQLTQTYSYSASIALAGAIGTGANTVQWSTSGSLPPGVTKGATSNTSFAISGTPTTAGTYTYTVTALDPWDNSSVSTTVTYTVSGALTASMSNVSFRASAPLNAAAPTATSASPSAGNGTGPYTWSLAPSSNALPAWASVNATTGLIVGRPSTAQAQAAIPYRLRATDSKGVVGDATFTLAVTTNTVAVTAPSGNPAYQFHVGYPRTFASTSTNAASPTWYPTYNGTGVAYPSWLTVNPSNGTVTGTPTATQAATTYYVFVVDGVDGAYNSNNFTLSVLAPMAFTTQPSDVNAVTNSPITSTTPVVSNKIGTVTYKLQTYDGTDISATLGNFVAGLSFNTATGVISGTPTAAGTVSNATILATDPSDGSTVQSNRFLINSTQSNIAVTNMTPVVRATKQFTANATTSLSSPTWSTVSSTPSGMSASVSGTTLTGTAPAPSSSTTTTNYSLTMKATSSTGGSYTLTAPAVSTVVVPKLAPTMAAVSGKAGDALNVGPAVNIAYGTMSYTLTAGGVTSPTALSSCGIAFDPATGKLTSSALKVCSFTGATITVSDDGNGATAAADSVTTAGFNVSIVSPYSISLQPYSFTVAQGGTGSTKAYATGTPVGSLTWQLLDNNNGAAPDWLAMSSCSNTGCTVTASPGAAVATGTYPSSTGTYKLVATDANGTVQTTSGFTVTVVVTQDVSNTRPAYIWYSSNGSACDVGVPGCGQQPASNYPISGTIYSNNSSVGLQYQYAMPVTVTQLKINVGAGTYYCGQYDGNSANGNISVQAWNGTAWSTIWGTGWGAYYGGATVNTAIASVTASKFRVTASCSNPNGWVNYGNFQLGNANGFAP